MFMKKTTGYVLPTHPSGGFGVTDENLEDLPDVRDWVGLKHWEGKFNQSLAGTPVSMLTTLNDAYNEWDFNKLADLIESEPEGLFWENV